MSQPESALSLKIQRELKRSARDRGHELFIFKVHGSDHMMSGLPDLVACYRGLFVGLEVKMPGNKRSARQEYVGGLIERAGGLVMVPYSVAEALVALDQVDARINKLAEERAALHWPGGWCWG